jgi:hypothetical protein
LAKKRRQKIEKKDEIEFNFPEFDEHKFISLELSKAKISLISFLFAIGMVFITYQLYLVTYPDARAPMVLGIFGVVALPLIVKQLKIDISEFDWKNWFGGGAVYVFSWLAIFIIAINPPFSDFVEPEIDESIEFVRYMPDTLPNSTTTEKWIAWDKDSDPNVLISPTKINFTVKIIDNSAIIKDSVRITINGIQNNTIINERMNHVRNNKFNIVLETSGQPFPAKIYDYTISVKDNFDHKTTKNGQFQIL